MAKKSFCTIALEFCRSVDLKYKCSKIPPPSNSKDMHARRDIQEVQPQLPLLCRRISSIPTVSRVGCWSTPDKQVNIIPCPHATLYYKTLSHIFNLHYADDFYNYNPVLLIKSHISEGHLSLPPQNLHKQTHHCFSRLAPPSNLALSTRNFQVMCVVLFC